MNYTLYLIKFRDSDYDPHSMLIFMSHETGRRWTNDAKRLQPLENGRYHDVHCHEVLSTTDFKIVLALIENEFMEQVEALICTYDRTQHYGGPEEGGWYYHNDVLRLSERVPSGCKPEDETDHHGEGTVEHFEPIPGIYENTEKPHYC